jgi:hypothetical protein
MIAEEILNFFTQYISEDFENWLVGVGTVSIALGTILLAYAAIK